MLTRRQIYDTRQRRHANLIAAASTVAVILALVLLVPLAPGWQAVRRAFFNGEVFAKTFPGLLNAFLLDVAIFAWCAPLIALLALLLAILRDLRAPAFTPLRLAAILFIDVFRGLPVILVIYLIGFGIPGLGLPRPWNSPYIWGSLSLILVYAAYTAEVIRSGIESIHLSQRNAALSLGLSEGDTMRFVILPQAIRRVIPANMNLFIALQKDVALLELHRPGGDLPPGRCLQIAHGQFHALRRRRADLSGHHHPRHPLCRLPDEPRPAATLMTQLALEDIRKAFGANHVLNGIDLNVAQGEMICLIGASGSGKSTLLKAINLLEPIDDGRILLDGRDISEPGLDPQPIRQRIGMVFQSFNLFPHMTALENALLAPARIRKRPRKDLLPDIEALFERFGLADRMTHYPDQLSGGQQQRTAIVRALAMQPEIMLFDEITSALDPELVGEVLDVLRSLRGEGMTMILATHEMGFARELADKVCFLDGGRILEQGPPDALFGQPQHARTRAFLSRVVAR